MAQPHRGRPRSRAPKVPDTKARRALQRIVDASTQDAVAAKLGIGQQAVSSILGRLARASASVRDRASVAYGIPTEDWYTAAELREVRSSALPKAS